MVLGIIIILFHALYSCMVFFFSYLFYKYDDADVKNARRLFGCLVVVVGWVLNDVNANHCIPDNVYVYVYHHHHHHRGKIKKNSGWVFISKEMLLLLLLGIMRACVRVRKSLFFVIFVGKFKFIREPLTKKPTVDNFVR